ncbi:MAG: type VI secretion system protein TssA [Gemmatimonadetes bacterium]|nr:type VI secretion system protein TssA [Gemmatimonadota bacterium]
MPLATTELLEPIPGDSPGGVSLRYDPLYDQIKQARTEEDDLPAGDWSRERKTADWGLVVKLATEALKKRSKDLQIAAWLTEALLKREGVAGLTQGLGLLQALIENFWDHLHPELEDGDAEFRAAPLEWVGGYLDRAIRVTPITAEGHTLAQYRESRTVGYEKDAQTSDERETRRKKIQSGLLSPEEFDEGFAATPKSWYKAQVAEFDAALEALDALDLASQEKFGDVAPSYAKLRDALKEVRQILAQFLATKLETDPDPVEEAPPAEVVAEAAEGEAAAAAPAAAAPQAGATLAPTPRDRADAEARVAAAARWMRAQSPTDPAPYLMLRGLRWGELRAGGPVEPRLLAAPPTELRTRLKGLLLESRWEELLEAGEEVMATPYGRGWLDLQRYVLTACDALGAEYAPVAAAIRGALAALLRDRPELPALTLADDSPAANAETRAWLRGAGLLAAAEAGTDEPAVVPTQPVRDAFARAQRKVKEGQPHAAIEILLEEAAQERSLRGRFLRRTQAAAIMMDAGLAPVALPILRELVELVDKYRLEEWEDGATVAQPLGLLHRCIALVEGESSAPHDLYVRVCRLDPMQAIRMTNATRPA